jgi:RNA polymerase sigma-70 factor (ECF subfamily)
MLRYRDGDAAAFDALYARHKGGVFRYLLRQCGNRSVAEELFQDVWMNLIRSRTAYTVQARFTTYLFRLAHNRVIDHYRSSAGRVPVSFDDEDCPDIEAMAAEEPCELGDTIDRKREARRLMALINGLPDAQREAFLLQQESGLSIAEIADATEVSRETAKSRLRYALAKLRQGMREIA